MNGIQPFFVIGNPRSGTTLLRLMLNQHTEIVVPPESGFSVWLADRFAGADFASGAVRAGFVDEVFRARKFETWGLDPSELRDFLDQQSPRSYRDAVLAVYLFYALKNGRHPRLIGDKNNFYIKYLDQIESLFERPRYVFIVRDGRDVACSYKALRALDSASAYSPRLSSDAREIAREWAANNAAVIARLERSPERSLLLKYEDLIVQPEAEMRRACAFFETAYQPEMLTYYQRNDEPRDFLAWKEKVVQPPDPANQGMYKTLLTPDEIAAFEQTARETLVYFGYL